MVDALDHVHSAGLTHRDLKPDNILYDKDFMLKIADFGFSAPLSGNDNSGWQKTYLGTPQYMAPEIHEGKPYSGEAVDIFAMGVILFIMMGQNPPFMQANSGDRFYELLKRDRKDMFWKMHNRAAKRAEPFPENFKDLFERMVAYNPAERITMA